MNIVHKITPFLYHLFEITLGDKEKLISTISQYYTLNGIVPLVSENDDFISVEISFAKLYIETVSYNRLINLCENRKFAEAYPLAVEMAHNSPSNSELNRIKGQIESELGEVDKAIDSLIDALRWDPENVYALIMMGNIYARDKNDIDTAMKYYEQASFLDPEDHISLNNIGGNLMQIGKLQEAKEFFLRAEKLSSEYPNTKFGLSYVSFSEGKFTEAYEYVLQAIKLNKSRDGLFRQSIDLAKEIA